MSVAFGTYHDVTVVRNRARPNEERRDNVRVGGWIANKPGRAGQ